MEWPIFLSLLSVACAVTACAVAVFSSRRLSVTVAQLSGEVSQLERTERLTPSKLAELAEFREALQRAEQLLEKVNRREIARSKARADDGTFTQTGDVSSLKDALRKRAGLRAGQPAPHS
jgi:hypothetical protein